ncbi:hypothetical protein [Kribbella sp. C-35]|uniref:hypothetical protein n=1 Tax=Kribbella sp. C-35 TaxID=2789276 RepID=UPI0039795E8E
MIAVEQYAERVAGNDVASAAGTAELDAPLLRQLDDLARTDLAGDAIRHEDRVQLSDCAHERLEVVLV